jgi:type VI secretion system secreted protein VgrG
MADDQRLEGIEIAFKSGALPSERLELLGVWGREAISRLFAFDFVFTRAAGPLSDAQLDDLLQAPAALSMGPKPGDIVHGLIESIELVDAARTVAARYRARLVPNVWLLTLSRSSCLFQDTTIPDMVRAVLAKYGMKEGTHFDVLMSRTAKSPKREYIVQYQENDWDFIQRWLEHEGFFYWFSHGKKGEKLIISDDNEDATPIDDPASISYRERNNLSSGRVSTVWDFGLRQKRIPARVVMLDYNYRTPGQSLVASHPIDEKRGFGTVVIYGDHFKNKDVGQEVAKLRAERVLTERRTYSGTTDCSRFRVGHTFELENHFVANFDQKYLVTSLEHRVGYPVLDAAHEDAARDRTGETPQRYSARFEAIPAAVAYRPERATPWPRINGMMHAKIDADGSGEYASIDGDGRYKVWMPYDTSGGKGAKASRWIRMSQPYAGPGYGSHHPLHKGVEVLLGHVDGDPDRPIIMGAVPNPHTVSPSTKNNSTQSVIQTASGIRIEMEDLQG